MTYTYRKKVIPEQRAEQDRQRLSRGLMVQRKGIVRISATISTLSGQLERAIAQAVWDDVPLETVASAAGVSVSRVRSIGLTFEDLPQSGATSDAHVQALRSLAKHVCSLEAQRREMQKQQEQLVVRALESRLLDPPWVTAVSGLPHERVNLLAKQAHQNKTPIFNQIPNAHK